MEQLESPLDSPLPSSAPTSNKLLIQAVLLMVCWLLLLFNWLVFMMQRNQESSWGEAGLLLLASLYCPVVMLLLYLLYKIWLLFLLTIEGLCWLLGWKLLKRGAKKLAAWSTPLGVAFVVQIGVAVNSFYQLLAS